MTSLSINPELPKRGEIWLVNFDPTVGAEIKKVRPAVVISSDSVRTQSCRVRSLM